MPAESSVLQHTVRLTLTGAGAFKSAWMSHTGNAPLRPVWDRSKVRSTALWMFCTRVGTSWSAANRPKKRRLSSAATSPAHGVCMSVQMQHGETNSLG